MGRTFDGSTSLYRTDSPPVTAPPFTVSGWFKVASSQGGSIFSLSDANGDNRLRLNAFGNFAIEVSADVGASSQVATSSLIAPTNVWAHACGVWTSAASRAAFLNGGNKGTDTVSATPTGITVVAVGTSFYEGFANGLFAGDLAEVAVWNVALTDAEVLLLSRGISPLRMRPGNLVAYYPLLRDPGASAEALENNYARNATDRSLNNKGIAFASPTTADSHPPVQSMLVGLRQGRSYGGITVVNLMATSYADNAPSFSVPVFGQKYALAADALIISPPTVPVGPMAQTQTVGATALAVPPPSVGASQLHVSNLLTANALAVPSPTLTVPATFSQKYVLTAALAPRAPILGQGALGQKHILVAISIAVPVPALDAAPFGAGRQILAASVATSPPALAVPAMLQKHALVADAAVTPAPVLGVSGRPISNHVVAASSLATSPPVFLPVQVGFQEVLHALGLAISGLSFGLPPNVETIEQPLLWFTCGTERWSYDPNAKWYDEDGDQDEKPVKQAIFTNLNDTIELTVSSGTLVGRTSPGRGPAESIQTAAPLFLLDHMLRIDIHQLAEDLAGLEVVATLPQLSGISADLNTLNDKILAETSARKAAVTTETNARAVADAALDARLVALETRSYVDRGGVALIAPDNDFVHQVADDGGVVILNPAGNLARGTFKLPLSPVGRQKIDFIAVKSVNNLIFLTDNIAHALANPPNGVTGGKCITAVFGPTLQTWLFFA